MWRLFRPRGPARNSSEGLRLSGAVTSSSAISDRFTARVLPWSARHSPSTRRTMSMTDVMTSPRARAGAAATDDGPAHPPSGRNGRVRAKRPAPTPIAANGDDDARVAVTGVVDVLENFALVRAAGYLPGPDDA